MVSTCGPDDVARWPYWVGSVYMQAGHTNVQKRPNWGRHSITQCINSLGWCSRHWDSHQARRISAVMGAPERWDWDWIERSTAWEVMLQQDGVTRPFGSVVSIRTVLLSMALRDF